MRSTTAVGATATLTQAQIDAGSVTNIADVTGVHPNGDPVTDSDTNTVSIDQNPALNTNIVDYDVIQVNGTPVLSTNKGLIDLVNSDPLIGNFNNFNNIENALTKDAMNDFLTNPNSPTSNTL